MPKSRTKKRKENLNPNRNQKPAKTAHSQGEMQDIEQYREPAYGNQEPEGG